MTIEILLIEDHADTLEPFAALLVLNGATVTTASTGSEGIKIYRDRLTKNPIDGVVTDLGLPDISGLEVLRQVREHNPKLYVAFVTGHHQEVVERERIKLNAPKESRTITKPILWGTIASELISDIERAKATYPKPQAYTS